MKGAPVSLVPGVALVFAVLGVVGFATQSSEAGQAQRSRVIDRTFMCSVPFSHGARQFELSGQSGVRDQGDASKWFRLASATLVAGNASLVGIQAGAPRVEPYTGGPEATSWIALKGRCRASKARVTLSPRGLGGGKAYQWTERYKCDSPKQVLLRVRVEFSAPVSPRTRAGVQSTTAPVEAGSFAVRTQKGKSLAYADVSESGRGRLFFAGNCLRA